MQTQSAPLAPLVRHEGAKSGKRALGHICATAAE